MPFEDGLGDAGRVAAFEAHVVLGAHPGEQGDLFAAEAFDAASAAEVGQPGLLRGEAFPPRGQELANVVPVVHGSNLGAATAI